jgi:cobalt-zinc-cadmium efflux system membrane fusion protein
MKPRAINKISILLIGALLAGCGPGAASDAPPAPASPASNVIVIPQDSPQLAHIRVEPLQEVAMSGDEFFTPGRIEVNPNRISRVTLPVAGRVTSVLVKTGDQVSVGQTLLTIESPEAQDAAAAYAQGESGVAQAAAALTQANLATAKAKADYDRAIDLFENDAIAKKELLNAESIYLQAKAASQQAQAALEQAQAARVLGLKRMQLLGLKPGDERLEVAVRAPLSGKVLELAVVAGEFRPDPSAPVMTIADLRSVWLISDVPENAIRLVGVGEPVEIHFDAYPGEEFRGRTARIADTLDPRTRTLRVVVELDNQNGRLKPEMFGRVRHRDAQSRIPALPAGAIVQDGPRSIVYVERATGEFEAREIVPGRRSGDMIAIASGVALGERVVVDGVMLLRN